ncbi:hypothetical protein niasHS_012635 [Heterodera schachtii]|uniref:Uncharacterized protein n=1 Tax=Heterodera schachtii TaxID=97005 RepID=A0ABD2IP00_HETSC
MANHFIQWHFISVDGTSLQSIALHFCQWHFNSVKGTSFHPMALHFTRWHFISLDGTSLQSMALHFSQWHCISLNSTSFHSMALHFSQWHFISPNGTLFQSMALHFSQWHFTSLNGTALQSMALHFIQWHSTSVNGTSFSPIIHKNKHICHLFYEPHPFVKKGSQSVPMAPGFPAHTARRFVVENGRKPCAPKKKSGMTPLLADGLGHFWRAKNALGSRLYAFFTRRPKANGWEGMPATCDHHSKRLWNRSWNSKCVALPSKSAMFGVGLPMLGNYSLHKALAPTPTAHMSSVNADFNPGC